MLKQLKGVYRRMPSWLTAPVKYVPNGLLFGSSYRRCCPTTDISLVPRNLKSILDYTREHTEWGKLHIPHNVVEDEAERILASIPIIDSEQLHTSPQQFVSSDVNARNAYWATTGETGRKPTSVCLSDQSYGYEWRHILAIWELGGYSRSKDLKLTLRGYHFRPGEILRRDPVYNEISVDSFQLAELSDVDFRVLIDKLIQLRVSYIHGYPTLVDVFMERLEKIGKSFPVRALFLGSEGTSAEKKKQFSRFFEGRVLSWYGLTEKVVLAYDEFADNRFKVFTSYGYPRILEPDSQGIGEIVGTTFVNWAMPLINYKTGDYGRIVKEGSSLIIEKLSGRSGKDFIYESAQKKYPITAINLPENIQGKIVFYQIIQNDFAKILVLVLPRICCDGDRKKVLDELYSEIKARLPSFDVNIRMVDDERMFERSKRGKLRMVVQNIKVN